MELDLFWWTSYKPRINWSDPHVYYCMAVVVFNPVFWNITSRLEYHTKFLSNLFGSSLRAAKVFCATIAGLALVRMKSFELALQDQDQWELLETVSVKAAGWFLLWFGIVIATWAIVSLEFYGFGFGDCFGIMLDHKVTSFPFNVFSHPMYLGSTLEYVGVALIQASPTGLLLSALVGVAYLAACWVEDPFTEMIYSQRIGLGVTTAGKKGL